MRVALFVCGVQWSSEIRSYFAHFAHFAYMTFVLLSSAWVKKCQSAIVYERRKQAQVVYVIPVSSILGRLALVLVGATGTIPFDMRKESADFPGAACEKTKDCCDCCR